MKRMILVCWLCVAATSVYAEGTLVVVPKTGCQIWIPCCGSPPSISWSGECNSGKANGKGTLEWHVNGTPSIIKGIMKDGRCIRDCSLEIKGKKYVGEFENGNVIGGFGTMTDPDGKIYSGEWKDGSKHGKGTMTYPSTNKDNYAEYKGEWERNSFHGEGVMIYKNGDKYSGSWSEGKEHGKGTYTFKDGTSYQGLWEHGERIKIF